MLLLAPQELKLSQGLPLAREMGVSYLYLNSKESVANSRCEGWHHAGVGCSVQGEWILCSSNHVMEPPTYSRKHQAPLSVWYPSLHPFLHWLTHHMLGEHQSVQVLCQVFGATVVNQIPESWGPVKETRHVPQNGYWSSVMGTQRWEKSPPAERFRKGSL